MKIYEHAMIPLEAEESVTTQVTVGALSRPPGTAWPYDAIKPAWANRNTARRKDPDIMRRRLGHRSMNISAGTVITTLIMYWIDAVKRFVLPDSPAIWKIYTM